MTNRVATVIRCADLVQHVYSTLESIERQTLGRGEIATTDLPSYFDGIERT